MPTTALKAKLLKFPLIKFNKIQNKKKESESFQLKIGHTQNLGWATTIMQQFASFKSGKFNISLSCFFELRRVIWRLQTFLWLELSRNSEPICFFLKHLASNYFTHSKYMRVSLQKVKMRGKETMMMKYQNFSTLLAY